MKTIEKGTRIICPDCREVIATAVRNIYGGEIIHPSMFSFIGEIPDNGTHLNCPWCKTAYGRSNYVDGKYLYQLHTEDGWK